MAHPRRWTVQSKPVRIAALVGVVVSAIALAAALMRSREPAVAPIASSASGRPAIAVMNFEIVGASPGDADAWLAKGVPSMLVTGLAQMPNLDIVSGQRLREVSAQDGLDNLDVIDRSRAAAVARRAGAGAIVVGTVFKTGADVRIDAQLEDLSSGRVLAAESVRGTDLYALADQLAAKIRDGIGFDQQIALRKVADISSASLEAYKLYADGVDAYINARFSDAEILLRRAVAIDPDFVQAYAQLAFVNHFAGQPAAAETYLRKAADRAERLTERERLLVRAELARVEGRFVDAARLTDQLVERFADYDNIYPLVVLLYNNLESSVVDPDKAVLLLEAGVKALPRSAAVHLIFGYALMAAGRFDDARRELETSVRLAPREPNPYDSLGELHLAIGEPAKAIEFYSRAFTIQPTFGALGRSWALAALGRYDEALADGSRFASFYALFLSRVGRYREASTELAAGLKQAEASGSVAERLRLQLSSAVFSIELRSYARARKDIAAAERTIAELPQERRRIYVVATDLLSGIIDARTRSLPDARLHLDSMKRRSNPAVTTEGSWRRTLQSEIALAANQPEQAVAVHSADEPGPKNWFGILNGPWMSPSGPPFRDGLARAKQAQGDLQGAIATYRELLTPGPRQGATTVFEPRYVLEIARLLEQTGDRATARHEYMRFLDMWKRADAELPELDEARTALARLR
jgi:tetratricopeptide (TPR) repeat protein